ncbi:timeless protein-domain-containing protein [Mycena crocata]|nr:timeless protein-domain-containing protein [Mycena crocata]
MSDYSSDEEQPQQEVPRDPATLKTLNPRRLIFEPVIGRVVDALGGYETGASGSLKASGCLKDLKKLWRKDDTDDERTVARIFWEKRVLLNDLIPILLLTAGAGQVEDKCAIADDLPIDMAEELAELDSGERADFTQLRQSHQHYKAAILQPVVMSALFGLLLPPLAKAQIERTLRDNQVAALVLHIMQNLAAIRDSEGLQSRLLRALQQTHLTDLLLTAAANSDADPLLASWKTLVVKTNYDGNYPALQRLLAAEAPAAPAPTSRHPRFGTTITVLAKASSSARALVHTTAPTPLLLDAGKRPVRARAVPAAEAALVDHLTLEARDILRNFARASLKEGAFNAFLTRLLKDIRMERSWATGDRVGQKREFGHVGAAVERGFVSWVLRRMREASDEKPKGWTTLYAGMGCLTQLLLILDAISTSSSGTDADADAVQTLTAQLIYAGAPLDLALECLRACSAATATGRGPAFLDAAVHMLERGADGGDGVYVRKDEDEGAAEERRKKQETRETTFSLDAFEMKLASAGIMRALLLQLTRFKELQSDALQRVVSTLYLFQSILAAEKTFPRDQPHRDLVQLALEEEPFPAVEAFFPKNRGHWKAFSSWEPPEKGVRAPRAEKRGAGEVQVKRGYSWSEQLGIVIAALVDAGKIVLIIEMVIRQWERITSELEAAKPEVPLEEDMDDDEVLAKRMAQKLETPSPEMREKMVDFLVPYGTDEEAEAATRNPQLRLLLRLAKCTLMDEVKRLRTDLDLEPEADGSTTTQAEIEERISMLIDEAERHQLAEPLGEAFAAVA